MGFEIGDFLRNVTNLDTEKEQIEYIDINNIVPDPKNFYSMDGIEELAESIELLGLQQPIRVRAGDSPDKVIIVSGHRRREALQLLVGEGKDGFASVPCIREKKNGSEAMQQLRLIYANAGTRQLSSYELAEQAKQTEELLYKLSDEGLKFPGRMRDKVAEACKVSASRIARLKVIDNGLIGELRDAWIGGILNESCAYRLAREPKKWQMEFQDLTAAELAELTQQDIEDTLDALKEGDAEEQADTDTKTLDKPLTATVIRPENPDSFDGEAYIAQFHDETEKFYKMLKKHCIGYIYALENCTGRKEGIEHLKDTFGRAYNSGGDGTFSHRADPKGLALRQKGICEKCITRTWTEVYDMLAVIAMRSYNEVRDKVILDSASAAAPLPSKPKWRHGDPPQSGTYAAKFDADGLVKADVAYYNSCRKRWYYSEHIDLIHDELCVGWYPLPED